MAKRKKKKARAVGAEPGDPEKSAVEPGAVAEASGDPDPGPDDVLTALSIPRTYAGHASIPTLEVAHELFVAGNYGAARRELHKVHAMKDLPEPISKGVEVFEGAMAIDTTSLIAAGLLALFLVFILFEVY